MVWAALCALYNLGWGLFHLLFWRLLRWKTELPLLSRTNAGVMQILNICLTWLFFVMAYLFYRFPSELVLTPLGRTLTAGMLLFWLLRTVLQVVYMNMGQRVHQVLLGLFVLGVALHAGVLWA